MKSIVTMFWQICTFQKGPDAIPYSVFLLSLVIAINAIVSIVVSSFLGESSWLQVATLVVVNQAGAAVLVSGVLSLMGLASRIPQTLTAWFGADLILTLISGVAFGLANSVNEQAGVFAVVLIGLWVIAVYGFILHRATNMHIGLGVALSFLVAMFSTAISQTAIGA